MSKYVLVVHLEIQPESVEIFKEAARKQAEHSVRDEPGCHHFEVIQELEHGNRFTNYEIFEDVAAFEAHTTMPHTNAFRSLIEPIIVNMEMRSGGLVASNTK